MALLPATRKTWKKKNDEYVGRNDQLSLAKNMREGAKYTCRERLKGLRATLACASIGSDEGLMTTLFDALIILVFH